PARRGWGGASPSAGPPRGVGLGPEGRVAEEAGRYAAGIVSGRSDLAATIAEALGGRPPSEGAPGKGETFPVVPAGTLPPDEARVFLPVPPDPPPGKYLPA